MFDRKINILFTRTASFLKVGGIAFAVLLLNACQTDTVKEPSVPPTKNQLIKHNPNQDRINNLLDEAYTAFKDNKLTTPIDDNAYLRYLQVLSISPTNRYANQGIAEIVEKYLEWAMLAANVTHYNKAFDYLNKAHSVDELHPNITAVEKLIKEKQHTTEQKFLLPLADLRAKTNSIIIKLNEIALLIERTSATVVINAPKDADGRWIYQQLNMVSESRIRATFQQGTLASVRVLYK